VRFSGTGNAAREQRLHDLREEKRVATRRDMGGVGELLVDLVAHVAAQEGRNGVDRERAKRHVIGERVGGEPSARARPAPPCDEEQDRNVDQSVCKEVEEPERRVVRPVDVVGDE
jgi:hypothetical protein